MCSSSGNESQTASFVSLIFIVNYFFLFSTNFHSLVVKEDEPAENDYEDTDRDDFEKDNSFIGKGDGVLCRRDKVRKFVVHFVFAFGAFSVRRYI